MMPSPVFALYLTCLFLTKTAEMTDLEISSAHQKSGFILAEAGDKLTLKCVCEGDASKWFYWYKQPLGQKPKLISSYSENQISDTFPDEFKNNPRFTLDTGNGKNHLTISDLHISDSATYYCISSYAYVLTFVESFTVIVKSSGLHISNLVHYSTSETIQPGGSVTLNCTVQTGTCDGEHSVYWLKNSGESHPGLIFGGSNDQCERKPNTQTQTCVYSLPMKNLSLSHAGTYYCAVASCGHIVFGNGTQLDFEHELDSPVLVYMLSGALALTTLLVVLLSHSMYKMRKRHCRQSKESQARFLTPSTTNTEFHQEDDHLHYAALSVNLPNRSRKQRNNTENECLYSSVKQ